MGKRSPFRSGFLGVELFYGGAWHDVTADLGDDGVTITRGRSPEGGRVDPSSATLRLRNGTGTYSPRNPRSPLYGLIGRNTPIRVWTEHSVSVRSYRFWGEVVEWPQRWERTGARSAYAPIVAAGVLRRLGQGASPLRSPMRRALSGIGSNLVAYWPCEEGSEATSVAPLVGTKPAVITGGVPSFAGYSGFLSSEPVVVINDAKMSFQPPTYASTGAAQVRWLSRLNSSIPDQTVLLRVRSTGTLGYCELRYRTASSGSLLIEGFNDAGASVGAAALVFSSIGGLNNKRLRCSVEMTQSGGNIAATVVVLEAGAAGGVAIGGTFTGVTLGSVTNVDFNVGFVPLDVPIGHVTVEKAITSVFAVSSATLVGYSGESASSRLIRLCSEAGVALTTIGTSGSSLDGGRTAGPAEFMGVQGLLTLVDLLDEAREVGGGILYEPRDSAGLALRTIESLYSQTPVSITYQDNLLRPFEPTDDDATTRNRVTVTRATGAAYTAEVTEGPLSTQAAPNGVGLYDEDVTLSLASDAQAEQHASWRVHLGTHDEARWPQIGVDLADSPWLSSSVARDAMLAVDLGDRVDVSDLPAWLPPDDVSVLVQGVVETIAPLHHTIVWSCSPARPYRAAYYNSGDRYSGVGTELASSMTTTSTSVTVTPPAGVQWSSADGPFGIKVAGEEIQVGNVTGSGSTQTFSSLTRSVNGVVKAHVAGEAVDLADPCYIGL